MQKKPIHPETESRNSSADDQKDRGYYYDDAHGYEDYEADENEDEPGEKGSIGEDDNPNPVSSS